MRTTLLGVLTSCLLWSACGDSGSDGDDTAGTGGTGAGTGGVSAATGGTGGDGGTGGGNGGTGGTVITGPAIDSAPPDWMAPADCGGVGELCEGIFCGGTAICQSIGNVCVPGLVGGAFPSKSAETPYCAAFTCMTFEQASCFCTGPAGETVDACSSPGALAGLCEGQGASCNDATCCEGLDCVEGSRTDRMVCEQTCTTDDDCDSGCCTDLRDTGVTICAPQSACDNPCKKEGEACTSSDTGNDCCRGSCVDSEVADFAGCRPYCNVNADCDTGCCELFANQTYGFCVPSLYCDCAPADDCTATVGPCCEGYECIGSSVEDLACSKLCTDDTECTTGCCGEVIGATWRTCQEPVQCTN